MVTIYESTDKNELETPPDTLVEETSESGGLSISLTPRKTPKNEGLFSVYAETFLEKFEKTLEMEKTQEEGSKINVSAVLGRLARLYERIRTTVEYKGEHVLRRNAIERILKRLVWEQGTIREDINTKKVADSLIRELIWAGYLTNNTIPEKKSEELADSLDKYLYLLKNLDNPPSGLRESTVRNWIWGVASSEIEEILDPSHRELYVRLMYEWFKDYFDWVDPQFSEHYKNIQIYLAIHRSFVKSDESIMRYNLLLKEFPNWRKADKSQVHKLILEFPKLYEEIEKHLSFPGRMALFRLVQRHAAAFDIFREIALEEKENLRRLLGKKKSFEEKIINVCEIKYKQISKRVSTGVVRSIIYIFLTKIILALLIEIPYELYFIKEIRYIPLFINIIIPPSLMWVIGSSIRVPGAKNTESIVKRLSSVIYGKEEHSRQEFSLTRARGNPALNTLFGALYSLIFVLVFGSITYLLAIMNFTVFATLVFFVFLSMVLLFAFRIRYNANQLKVGSDEETFLGHIFSYVTLPFLNFGFYLSRTLAKVNFLSIILDFLIEVPLKNMIEVFEEWTAFLKQKKEEVVEIPE